MDLIEHHADMATAMTLIVDALPSAWPAGLINEARDYLAANEYGLALELLVSGVAENGLPVSQPAEAQLVGLASRMGLDAADIGRQLSGAQGEQKRCLG